MSDLNHLLDAEPVVATAGTDMLAASIEQQGSEVVRSDWRPPEPGTEAALATLAADGRNRAANETALARMLAVRPQLVDVSVARDVFPGMTERTFFHAGPPLTWERASGPMRGAIIGAMIYEGLADRPCGCRGQGRSRRDRALTVPPPRRRRTHGRGHLTVDAGRGGGRCRRRRRGLLDAQRRSREGAAVRRFRRRKPSTGSAGWTPCSDRCCVRSCIAGVRSTCNR